MNENKKGFWSDFFGFGRANDLHTRAGMYEQPATPMMMELDTISGTTESAGGDSSSVTVPPSRDAIPAVTVETALSLSAVYRSVDIVANSIQQLELGVWRGDSEMKKTPAIVSRPDINMSPSKFLKKTALSMATHGNAYRKVTRQDNNDPTSPVTNLEVLNPLTTVIEYDKKDNKGYRLIEGTKSVWVPEHRVKHLKLMEVWGQEYGIGPIQACRAELETNLRLRHYSSRAFSEYPTGIVASKEAMNQELADQYAQRWYQADAEGRRVKFLGNGVTYQPVMLNPEDAQFLENQTFSITQVARMFGIPANYLLAEVAGNSMTYQNMEQVDTTFVRYTLTGYLREIEEAFTDLLPRGQRARFKLEGFLRADDKTRAEVNEKYINMGVLLPEEVRVSEGWGEMPEELKEKNDKPAPVPQSPNAAPPQSPITGEDNNE